MLKVDAYLFFYCLVVAGQVFVTLLLVKHLSANFSWCMISHLSFYLYYSFHLRGPITKNGGEDGRGEEGDDSQQDRHTSCESEDDFLVRDT